MTRLIVIVALAAAPTLAQVPVPPPFTAFLMDEGRERALARSAAPPAITERAGYYVLRASGAYEVVAPTENGFECLVQRSFTTPSTNPAEFYEPRIVAPICFNAEAARTVMQRDLLIAPLVERGTPLAEIRRAEAAAYESGRLRYPAKTAIAYMFSSAQWLGANVAHWFPHVMVWAPDLTPADLVPEGTFGVHSGLPFMDPRLGPKQPLIAIPIGKAIDPVFPKAQR